PNGGFSFGSRGGKSPDTRHLRESLDRALVGFLRLDLAIAGWRSGFERMDEFVGGCRDFVDGGIERFLVYPRGLAGPTQLANELQGGRADFVGGRGLLEVSEGLNVPAHGVGPR